MKPEKPGIRFLSVAWSATWPKPAGDTSLAGNEHREALACIDPDALSRFEGEGGPEDPELAALRRTFSNRSPAADESAQGTEP